MTAHVSRFDMAMSSVKSSSVWHAPAQETQQHQLAHHAQQQLQQGQVPPALPRKEFSLMEKMNSLRRFIPSRPLPLTPAQQAIQARAAATASGYNNQGKSNGFIFYF